MRVTRSRGSIRRSLSVTAAGALMLAAVPALTNAQTTDDTDLPFDRGTEEVCDGSESSDFPDVAASVHRANIECLFERGLTQGRADGTYGPRVEVRRDQMASFVARFVEDALGEELPAGDVERFDDDDRIADVHADNVGKLVEADIVRGFPDGTYRPQAEVTRQQMASFIRFAISYIDDRQARPATEPPTFVGGPIFEDEPFAPDHLDSIRALAGVGIVQGNDDGTYRPTAPVFRDAMASFVMRAYDYVEAELRDGRLEEFEVALSWFDEVSTEAGGAFGADDVFAIGDAGEPGDDGADGTATLIVDEAANTVAFEVDYAEVAGPFGDAPGFHIHEGDRDENGPVVVLLATGPDLDAADGSLTATVDAEDFDVSALLDDPDAYYLNLHSEAFPAGAIRGQLPDGPPSIDTPTSTWSLTATPDEVVDGGQDGASATFELTFDSVNDVVCYEIDTTGFDASGFDSPAHTATHIHQADEGETGPPRVAFRNPMPVAPAGSSQGCHSVPQATNTGDPDNGVGFSLAQIEDDPKNFYVDIHTDANPEGAVRAQLERGDVAEFEVALSWFDEVSTDAGEMFGDDDVFATGDAGDPGQDGAQGAIDLTVDSRTNEVTYVLDYEQVDGPFGDGPGLHIHAGDRDENGPVVVFLADGTQLDASAEDGSLTATVSLDRVEFDVADILDAPQDYYVNLHSDAFPAGAVRGQLPDGPPTIAEDDVTSLWLIEADPEQAEAADEAGGEPGASATFALAFDSVNEVVCYRIVADGVSGGYQSMAHTSTHIHQGDAGEAGPPRVMFRNPVATDAAEPDGERTSQGCHRVPQATNTPAEGTDNGVGFGLAQIEDDPSNFYVDIHTEAFVPGAVRGQFAQPVDPDGGVLPGPLQDLADTLSGVVTP